MLKIHNFEALHDKKYSVASMLFHYLNAIIKNDLNLIKNF